MALDSSTLEFLRNHGREQFRAKELARRLGLRGRDEYTAFRDALDALVRAGKVRQRGEFFGFARLDHAASGQTGRLVVHPQGFGFVSVEGVARDFFVPAGAMGGALDGDLVTITVRANDGAPRLVPEGERREAAVADVVERGRTQLVGTFSARGAGATVHPDDARIPRSVWVREGDFGGATDGDKVVVALRDYGETAEDLLGGAVTRVLGRASDPAVRVLALALAKGIRADFPEEVEAEAAAIPDAVPASEIERRLDLRRERIFTIDPVDAKDFDDAIHVKEAADGTFELGVHIADVSHYVRPGTALDGEAFLRATSVYLVDRVLPMLPEHLSNRVCSLVPREDRLTYSCLMRVSAGGDLLDARVAETVIHSQERFSYEGAQAVLDGHADHAYAGDLRLADRVAKLLTRRRMAEGSVDFEQPEAKILLDENGHAVGVQRKERMATNRLIEEFMLLANRAVAKMHARRPFVYRVHDVPDAARIEALAAYVRPFNLTLPHTAGVVTSKDLSALLAQVAGTDEGLVVTQAALRAMAKAKYSARNAGHFGLAFPYYSHFTSPIRRYPDLIVHRLAKGYAAGGPDADPADLEAQAEHCSYREREAEQAERDSVKLKQVEFLQDRVGDAFDGVVTGTAKFGAFVELSAVLAEGLLHVRELGDDHYDYDPDRLALVGRHTGRRFRPGTRVRVVVLKADVDTLQVDLGLEDGPGRRPFAEREHAARGRDERRHAPAHGRKGGAPGGGKRRVVAGPGARRKPRKGR